MMPSRSSRFYPVAQVSLVVLGTLIPFQLAHAENWAHWRGPNGNGNTLDGKPPIKWSGTENVRWTVAIPGLGSGSPVVWNDRILMVSAVPTDPSARANKTVPLQFVTYCFNRADGSLRWQKVATAATPHQETHETHGFASTSPCTGGSHVYSHFGSRGLYCYTMDGDLVWQRNDFGAMNTRNRFGEGSSPTLVDDKILVPWDHEGQSYLYALDRLTGKTIWQTVRDEPTCWATPLVIRTNGRSGTTVVIEDSPTLKIVSENSVGETVDATPAPVEDQLFIRGEKHLFCIEEV
jgi:outer membrane protein assembly factor BamB